MRCETRPTNQRLLRPSVDAAIGSWASWNSIHCLRIPTRERVTLLWLLLNQPSKRNFQGWRILGDLESSFSPSDSSFSSQGSPCRSSCTFDPGKHRRRLPGAWRSFRCKIAVKIQGATFLDYHWRMYSSRNWPTWVPSASALRRQLRNIEERPLTFRKLPPISKSIRCSREVSFAMATTCVSPTNWSTPKPKNFWAKE